MARIVHDVSAKLTCGHIVTEHDLTTLKANRIETTMRISAWCETCGRFQPTMHTWQQSRTTFS